MIALICLLAAAALLALALWMRHKGGQAMSWPSVNGKVLDAFVDTADRESMRPVVRYRYKVGKTELEGWRVSYRSFGTSEAAMKKYVAPYKPGATVKVCYDPTDPRESVLDNTSPTNWKIWLFGGVAFLILAAYLTYA